MDIERLYNLIEAEFDVLDKEEAVLCIAPFRTEYYPENKMKVVFNQEENTFELYEIVRDKSFKEGSFADEYKALVALYVLGKNKYGSINYDSHIQDELRSGSSLDEIVEIFRKKVDKRNAPKRYSFFELKQDSIVLEKSINGFYSILFLGRNNTKKYIIKDRELGSAAVVLYNFSYELEAFYRILKKLAVQEDAHFIEQLKELYLLGYLEIN